MVYKYAFKGIILISYLLMKANIIDNNNAAGISFKCILSSIIAIQCYSMIESFFLHLIAGFVYGHEKPGKVMEF